MQTLRQACPQMPPHPSPASWFLPMSTSGLACLPGITLPVAMAMLLCLPRDEVCSSTPQQGAESSQSSSAVPATPDSAHLPGVLLQRCLQLHPLSPDAGPLVLSSSCLTGHRSNGCRTRTICQGVLFGRTSSPHHDDLPSASRTVQDQVLPSGRNYMGRQDLPHSAPHSHTALGPAYGAHSLWYLQNPLRAARPPPQCELHHCGVSSSNQNRNRPFWPPCRQDRLLPSNAMPSHDFHQTRAEAEGN